VVWYHPHRYPWGLEPAGKGQAEAGIWRDSPGHGGMSLTRPGYLLPALSIWHQLAFQRCPHNPPYSSCCCCHSNWLPS